MGLRHLARQRALQLLYGLEFNRLAFEDGEREFLGIDARRRKAWGDFAHELARRTWEERRKLDAEIAPYLERWKIERLPLTDRICLRMALCELMHFPDIPLRATLDEYVELAKLFGTEDSPKYINGVLNKIGELFPHKDFGKAEEISPESETGFDEEEAAAPEADAASTGAPAGDQP